MRSTSIKSFVVTLVLFFTLTAAAAPATPRQAPRDKQETVIGRFEKIVKRLISKLTSQDTIEISIPKP